MKVEVVTGRLSWTLSLAVVLLMSAVDSRAQVRPFPSQQAGVGYGIQTFAPEDGLQDPAFNIDGPVLTAWLRRQGLTASFSVGTDSSVRNGVEGDVRMVDFDIRVQTPLFPKKARKQASGIFLPLTFESMFRKLTRNEGPTRFDVFDYSGIAIGPGLAYRSTGQKSRIALAVAPVLGLATRSFGSSFGRVFAVQADVSFWSRPIIGDRFGLSLGYLYRWQSWHVGGLDAFDAPGQGRISYSGFKHGFTLGVAW